ncbi:hypothetical protein ACLKA7_004469 [Drosophila subpalustris]
MQSKRKKLKLNSLAKGKHVERKCPQLLQQPPQGPQQGPPQQPKHGPVAQHGPQTLGPKQPPPQQPPQGPQQPPQGPQHMIDPLDVPKPNTI